MRIGIDISPITQHRTGVGTYCYYVLKHMVQRYPDVVFKGFSSGAYRVELGPVREYVQHRRLPLPTRLLYRIWRISGAPRVDKFLGGVDVFHATNFFLPPTREARRVVSIYDLSFLAVPKLSSPRIVGPFSSGVRRFAHEADAIIACSKATKHDIETLLDVDPDKISVVYGAVDEDIEPVDPQRAAAYLARVYDIEGPFMLFVGTIEPRKNVAGLLRAFERVAGDVPHRLVLVGPMGWETDRYRKTLRDVSLGDRILHLGYIESHNELSFFYSAADAFVFPTFYEGFGLPLLEALACGCPVVTSEVASVPEATGGAAVYADPRDPDSIAGSICRVLDDKQLRQTLVERGLNHARSLSWQTSADKTLDVYRKVMSGERLSTMAIANRPRKEAPGCR